MIEEKFVDLYARNSGLRDKLVAERDVVLTYALRVLLDAGILDHLAFKGGTCLRKMIFGTTGRFSEDLDFTADASGPTDDVLVRVVETFNRECYGIGFKFDEYYKTEDGDSFGGDVMYRHAWNSGGRFRLQISIRERPTLPVVSRMMKSHSYQTDLEFRPFAVRGLETIEIIAEKVRAAFQRAKVRDLYDLYLFAATPFDGDLLRKLVVLKLWQVKDRFVPDSFFSKLRGGAYDWDDLRRLVRVSERIEPADVLAGIEARFGVLRDLTKLEQDLIADAASGWNKPLGERLRAEIRKTSAAAK
jgi:predicted nucleotidyltransferase component of viral defense system